MTILRALALAFIVLGGVMDVARAADPPPSAECRYALSQAQSEPKSDARARTCRARCAAFPAARAQCPRPAPPPPSASACDIASDVVVASTRPDAPAIQRCVDRCAAPRDAAKADMCRAKAHALCDDGVAAAGADASSHDELRAFIERADAIAASMCRIVGSEAQAQAIDHYRRDGETCLGPSTIDASVCGACDAARAPIHDACRAHVDAPPERPEIIPPSGSDDACRWAAREAQRAFERNVQHPSFTEQCLAMCEGSNEADALYRASECRRMQAQAGRVALVRLVAPAPAPWTLEPGSDAPVLAPWLGPLDNERRSLVSSGWAIQAGAGAHVRDGAVRGFDGGGNVVKGDGVGAVIEARALARGRRPGISGEVDGGFELRTLPSALSSSGLAFERAHAVMALGGTVDGLIAEHAQVDYVAQVGARRMPSMGISLRGTTLLWSLGLAWSDLAPSGSGLVAGVELDGADYGTFDSTERYAPLGVRVPLVASLGLSSGADFEAFITATFAPRWLKAIGFALPVWATIGASGCPWEAVCADVSVDIGARPVADTPDRLDHPPYYSLGTSWIARGKASVSVLFDASSALRLGVMIDPVTIPIHAEEVYKRPRLVQQALFFADARLAWDGAAYENGYFHGEVSTFASLDMPRLPLVIDAELSVPLGAPVGLALGARIPLGPVELALRYRGTPMFLGGYERDVSATIGIDMRRAIEQR